jgi:hypothetical protein
VIAAIAKAKSRVEAYADALDAAGIADVVLEADADDTRPFTGRFSLQRNPRPIASAASWSKQDRVSRFTHLTCMPATNVTVFEAWNRHVVTRLLLGEHGPQQAQPVTVEVVLQVASLNEAPGRTIAFHRRIRKHYRASIIKKSAIPIPSKSTYQLGHRDT